MIKKLLVILVILLVSCEKKPETPQEMMILGNWSVVNKSDKSWERDIRGFEFLPDGVCDYKSGYLDWERYENDTLIDRNSQVMHYLGTKTKYIVSKNSLKIFDLSEKKWDSFKIKKFSKDTLVIGKDSIWTTFVKKYYDVSKIPDFDAVIVSSSVCFGNCPANDIMISKTGSVLYKGNYFVEKKGWYTSKINDSELQKIIMRFKQADFMNLKNDYSTMVTDSQSISVSFIKNGKIIKTIEDYANSAPYEFIWAYNILMNEGQFLDLKQKKINSSLDNNMFFSNLITTDNRKGLSFASSEGFYLISILMEAKSSDTVFIEKYNWTYNTEAIKRITTDGRYYKLYFRDGKTQVKDIGFNFITESNLKNKFEIIKKINEQNN